MKNILKAVYSRIIITFFLLISLSSCHEAPDFKDDPFGNFDALAHIIDTKYCFLQEKDIDWAEVTARYRSKVTAGTDMLQLFEICAAMLDELQDGHVNLSSSFNTSYYRAWWTDYPQDFNMRTLQQYYLHFNYMQTSGIIYKILDDNIGYMYYPSFSSGIAQLNLDYILAILYNTDALILDIRDNGGGLLTNIDVLVSRFIQKETVGGYILHKTGPGHGDFSEPYEIRYKPAPKQRISWLPSKPVYVLTNRSCFSSANDFVAVMKTLPNVKIVGAKTGGGGGLPFSSELPNGWAVRFSASPILAPDGSITENGIEPSEGCEVHSPADELAAGKDAILEFAIEMAKSQGK